MRRVILTIAVMFTALFLPISAAFAESIPEDVLARIKKNVSAQWPGQYSLQKTLVDANVRSWSKLQHNYSDIPDSIFFEIRERKARDWPDQYSLQETLVDADVAAWKELNR